MAGAASGDVEGTPAHIGQGHEDQGRERRILASQQEENYHQLGLHHSKLRPLQGGGGARGRGYGRGRLRLVKRERMYGRGRLR